MPRIEIDTNLTTNELLPLVTDELKKLNSALSEAQVISFPDASFGWGNVINNISDCVNKANKYSEWINRINSSYINNINNNVDVLTKLNLEDIMMKETIVK